MISRGADGSKACRSRTTYMSSQAAVHSLEALKDLRVALTVYADDALTTLSSVDMEIRRVVQWLQYDRPVFWQEQIKRRREEVAAARAEVFRRKLAKTADYTPAYSEQKELLRRAEERLRDAEMRAGLVKKWASALPLAVLEYHASSRRITDLARSDLPRAVAKLTRMVEALEAYLREPLPSASVSTATGLAGPRSPLEAVADTILADDDPGVIEEPTAGPSEPTTPTPD
jgi:hypothetical protein